MRRKTDAEKLDAINRQYKQKNKYIAANYDRIGIVTPKGTKDRIKALTGQTINNYINELIAEDLKRREAAEDPEHNLQESRHEGPETKPQEATQGTPPGARTNRHEATKSRTEAQEATTSAATKGSKPQEGPKPRGRSRKASGANRSPQETTGGSEAATPAGETTGGPEEGTTAGSPQDAQPVEAAENGTKGSDAAADLIPGDNLQNMLLYPYGMHDDIPPEELPFH